VITESRGWGAREVTRNKDLLVGKKGTLTNYLAGGRCLGGFGKGRVKKKRMERKKRYSTTSTLAIKRLRKMV